jgi:hypothetical protein
MKVRTKLDEERLKKKQESDAKNYLDAVTVEDEEKGAKAIIEAQSQADKQAEEDRLAKLESLKISRRYSKVEYIAKLAFIGEEMARYIDWPKGFIWKINHNEEKLNVLFRDPKGQIYGRGIKPCGDCKYDFHALGVLMTQCENTVDQIMERGAYKK